MIWFDAIIQGLDAVKEIRAKSRGKADAALEAIGEVLDVVDRLRKERVRPTTAIVEISRITKSFDKLNATTAKADAAVTKKFGGGK